MSAAAGDRSKALALYEWNAMISASILHDLAHIEVGLRNAYDRALTAATPGGLHWSDDPYRFFTTVTKRAENGTRVDNAEVSRRQIEAARKAAKKAHRTGSNPDRALTGEDLIAELSFGFWRYLSTANREKTLWVPVLRHGFQPKTERKAVDVHADMLHQLRNRVAHHEPLLRARLTARHRDMAALARLISPQLEAHIDATSTWLGALAERPI
jgi:hypothetical protein